MKWSWKAEMLRNERNEAERLRKGKRSQNCGKRRRERKSERGERNLLDLAAKTRGKTAGIATLSTSSTHRPAFKEPLKKNNIYKDLRETLTTRDCLDSSWTHARKARNLLNWSAAFWCTLISSAVALLPEDPRRSQRSLLPGEGRTTRQGRGCALQEAADTALLRGKDTCC